MAVCANQQEIERTILAIRLKQPVQPEQCCQQSADPQHGRADTRDEIEIRPDTERHHRNHRQKEQYADKRAAASAKTKAHIPDKKRQHHTASTE
ncbi:hypothetical protein D9M72_601380 [compost metagenome]